ncbi:MAG: RNA-guided pseudouridylation complex pseudouridine synthase subunit Cbf5 [Aigarchaeota archaeon]|nr:RNA-guided pseudouridylation complex pseudouridine synthase subunit Cbf5 [Aigarchaeota archaeon]MCX8193069.1 RNA-guided pseudouridylation complex pseudouridine synthase subunit Cbf5 [Nitrososphaeria archaeon]MDW7986918.1 RNA-guided pseudouridylation complex pseudouridine synthase subunit Cbf5 [Nitrososphaerota archaeon]
MNEGIKPPWKIEPKILTRIDSESDPSYGEDPYKRKIDKHLKLGVVNLDKPRGPTSHDVAAKVKSLIGAEKTGLGGTLDPAVSGVLPILLDDATKGAGVVMGGGKEYICVMKLHGDVSDNEIDQALRLFTGDIYQLPPIRSSVSRTLRIRTIYNIELLERDGRYILLKIACSGGTYIRKLCYDIGLYLGVGAHMQELRRVRAGPFTEDSTVSLLDVYEAVEAWRKNRDETLLRKVVRPVEEAVKHLPKIYLLDSAVGAICSGANLAVTGVSKLEDTVKKGKIVAMMSLKGELVALGISRMDSEEIIESEQGIAVDTERVIMRGDLYPKIWKHKRHKSVR